MRLLLDTHAVIWFCEGNGSLSARARRAIEDAANECWVSYATVWEVTIKSSLGKLNLAISYDDLFPTAVEANGWQILGFDFRHYRELLVLPLHHRDPFDRLLVAQARVEKMTVVTHDSRFSGYEVPLLW